MPRPHGKHQIAMLRALDRPSLHRERGVWSTDSGWTWGTPSNTIRLCQQLVSRGLLAVTPSGLRGDHFLEFRLTPEGEAVIQRLKESGWGESPAIIK